MEELIKVNTGESTFITNETGMDQFHESMKEDLTGILMTSDVDASTNYYHENAVVREIASEEALSPKLEGVLTSPYRLDGESYEDFKNREKRLKSLTKLYKRYGPAGLERVSKYLDMLVKYEEEQSNKLSFVGDESRPTLSESGGEGESGTV